MTPDDFCPFYERGTGNMRRGFIDKVLISMFLCVAVLGAHYFAIGGEVFGNFGWTLSIIIMVASLGLFYATHSFRMLLPKLEGRLCQEKKDKFIFSISTHLSDKSFIFTGLVFGISNSLMGVWFGLPKIYDSILDISILLAGFFVAGFVCGMALSGIVGVTKCITNIADTNSTIFDYTSHDKCGGTQFIGWALLVFSMVTLVVGVLITVYISFTEWQHKNYIVVNMLYVSWVLLPYVASVFVLIVPAISINRSLTKYKMEKDRKFTESIKSIFDELEGNNVTPERKSELYADYEFQSNMRKELYHMRTWPFSVGTNSTYFFSVGSSIFTTYSSLNSWFFSTPPPF